MEISPKNIKAVIKENFELHGERISVTDDGRTYTVKSKHHGMNAELLKTDPRWADALLKHIKWQCPHLSV